MMVVETAVSLVTASVQQVVTAAMNNLFCSRSNRSNNHLVAMLVVETAMAWLWHQHGEQAVMSTATMNNGNGASQVVMVVATANKYLKEATESTINQW